MKKVTMKGSNIYFDDEINVDCNVTNVEIYVNPKLDYVKVLNKVYDRFDSSKIDIFDNDGVIGMNVDNSVFDEDLVLKYIEYCLD